MVVRLDCPGGLLGLEEGQVEVSGGWPMPRRSGVRRRDMTRSSWVCRRLRDFRAGIEGMISFLKRAFGLRRCTWRGELSFASYVQASVLTANLLKLARHLLA